MISQTDSNARIGMPVQSELKKCILGKVRFGEPMSAHTSFRIGGPADAWVEPSSLEDIKACARISAANNLPLFIIGGGTNLLVKDTGIRGIVVNMKVAGLKNIFLGRTRLAATSSVSLKELVDFCGHNGLSGTEFLTGIPGTVGGAVKTNTAARHYSESEKWLSVGDIIEELVVMNYQGNTSRLRKKDMKFGYKKLDISGCIILEAKFLLTESPKTHIQKECREFLARKKATQDLSNPSAGCVFRNPLGFAKPAGRMIDECGLKGMRIGGVAVSRKHANFIVNAGNGRCEEVNELIDVIRKKVKESFGVELELEIQIV